MTKWWCKGESRPPYPGWQMLTLAGQPAAYSGSPPPGYVITDADETLVWMIAAPGPDDQFGYAFTANIRGPQTAAIRSQLEAKLATLKLTPLATARAVWPTSDNRLA